MCCDHGCHEGVTDAESGSITCPVTGRTTQQLVSRHEERAMRCEAADVAFLVADLELSCFSKARAYTEGERMCGKACSTSPPTLSQYFSINSD